MITHQAIIASKANQHLLVSKQQDEKTKVNITPLSQEERVFVLANMASGTNDKTSLDFAKSLLAKTN